VTPGDVWLAVYASVVVVCAATVLLRREPTLVRGRSVFLFTLVYVALAWVFLAWRHGAVTAHAVPPRVLIVALVALGVTALAAPWWFVLGGPRTAVIATMELCFGRVCAQYDRVDAGFVMKVPGGAAGGGGLHVGLHALPWSRVTAVSFRARPPHRKSDLFRRLLVKQYAGVLPTIRIRMR
jgi:hypothetical protein